MKLRITTLPSQILNDRNSAVRSTVDIGDFRYNSRRGFYRCSRHPPGVAVAGFTRAGGTKMVGDRKSTRLNSSHANISYAVFCLKKKKKKRNTLKKTDDYK